jgi:ABC-type Mn2+/Zn2+ transport system ATPase subunit
MSGFKLLGIKLYEDYGVLKKDNYFQFYQESDNEIDLYSSGKVQINICSLVGKNGSGKSTLLELFYRMIYLLSVKRSFFGDAHKFIENSKNDVKSD